MTGMLSTKYPPLWERPWWNRGLVIGAKTCAAAVAAFSIGRLRLLGTLYSVILALVMALLVFVHSIAEALGVPATYPDTAPDCRRRVLARKLRIIEYVALALIVLLASVFYIDSWGLWEKYAHG